ncbi:MAG TPA: hypothetical protein VFV20_00440 [Candidatus Limnocylindria bacterium]|nr:hypothetical protein [Candidatus Limnocylindria bacterium]
MKKIALTLIAAGAVFATEASAQVMVRASSVPPGQRPPAGMCRVWIEGVPPGRQPAVTDCATARATAPLNSRIIFGSDAPFPGRATGRFRDGNCEFERRSSNLGDIFFGLRTSRRDSDRDCRVSSSRTRDLGVWYPVGRDSNGNVIYERRTRDRSGRIITERARSRDGRTLSRIGSNRDIRRARDRDDDDDEDDDRRMTRVERERDRAIRDREKAIRKQQKAIEKARRDREKAARKAGRGNRSGRDS